MSEYSPCVLTYGEVNLKVGHMGIASVDRWSIVEAAFGPKPVQTALDLERAVAPDVAFVDLAIVADGFYRPYPPVGRDPQ